MAKVTGPAFSVDAHGALGDGICFTRCMKGNRVILLPTHKDANSALQSVQRTSFITGKSMWKALSAASKAYYNTLAEGLAMTGYNLYIKKVLLGQILGPGWINDSFIGQVGYSVDDTRVWLATSTGVWTMHMTASISIGWPNDISEKQGCGVRFRDVGIPAKATILTAHVHMTGSSTATNTVKGKIVGNIDSDPAVFSNIADYQARRGTSCGGADNTRRTVKAVNWDLPATINQNVEYETPDIKEVIQELVDGAGYVSGRAMVLFIDDHDSQTEMWHYHSFYAWDGGAAKAARLHVTYKYWG